jgi:hypothetical protein
MSLFIGALFFGLQSNKNMHAVIVSRTALLYFVLAFGSSMSVAGIPFSMVERGIVEKEVRNKQLEKVELRDEISSEDTITTFYVVVL